LDGNQKFRPLEFKFTANDKPPKRMTNASSEGVLNYLKKWKKAKKAVLFRLSNKIIQVIF
jgi:hypothetical protein